MADFILKLNADQVLKEQREAFKEANELAARESLEAIDAVQWAWPNETERSNGSVVGSPRNIVDQGGLKGSYHPDAKGDAYSHTWDADYAAAVHNGAVFDDGHSMPARPWTKQPFGRLQVNFEKLAKVKSK